MGRDELIKRESNLVKMLYGAGATLIAAAVVVGVTTIVQVQKIQLIMENHTKALDTATQEIGKLNMDKTKLYTIIENIQANVKDIKVSLLHFPQSK